MNRAEKVLKGYLQEHLHKMTLSPISRNISSKTINVQSLCYGNAFFDVVKILSYIVCLENIFEGGGTGVYGCLCAA